MADFGACSNKYKVTAIGRCSEELAARLVKMDGDHNAASIELRGVGRFVEFADIIGAYSEGGWLAGIALFPDTVHYREKELTKFFEYMAVGLPIVASNFPVWKTLIEDQGVGICVNPDDNEAIEKALDWLRDHPEEAAEMGRRGKRLAREKYSWDSQAENLIGLYQEIMDKKRA
ncbi:glycosyltransferase [Marinobacter sp.]|uniref:glycosyltransferase n=1 Tax=Marinobacter sp. TaxID=50741 RepID=UPI003561B3D0